MLETDGLAPGLEISGSLLMVAGLGLSHGWAALSRRGPTNGQRFALLPPESMQRHQLSRPPCYSIALRICVHTFRTFKARFIPGD